MPAVRLHHAVHAPARPTPSPLTTGARSFLVTLIVLVAIAGVLAGAPRALAGLASRHDDAGPIGRTDGRIGDRTVTVLDTDEPAVSGLTPALRQAFRTATAAAAHDGIALDITSGWRSRAYQQWLLDRAVDQYGSLDEARRWVNTPDASTHVTGHAVDVGPATAARWLDEHGSAYGLCRVYANEDWHFELLTSPGGDCPAERADAR